jgi:acetylornithine deacetylase/succinyl-diaminopimelate desuccinylase-like protein
VTLPGLTADIPAVRREQAALAASVLGDEVRGRLPFVPGVQPLSDDPVELLLGSHWRATLAVTGADGLPPVAQAGNVLLPRLSLKLSLRLPPTVDAEAAAVSVKRALEQDPPYGARVRFETESASEGWHAPVCEPWLEASMQRASQSAFGRPMLYTGVGGTIPFMAMLGRRFPRTQFMITGVLGPLSNAHGPNEFLHLAYAERITACVVQVLGDHAVRPR